MFSAIVTCHNSDPNPIIRMLRRQTLPPDEILVETSGECARIEEPVNHWDHVPDEHDYGYRKRNRMAQFAKGKWLGFFNHDDSYHPRYIELMRALIGEHDIVYCDWSTIPQNCTWERAVSTVGNFIVHREKFLEVGGFPTLAEDEGHADARFIEATADVPHIHLPAILYYHNVPYAQHIKPTYWGNQQDYDDDVTYSKWKHVTDQQLKAMMEATDA